VQQQRYIPEEDGDYFDENSGEHAMYGNKN
jgi:hypothetical protein